MPRITSERVREVFDYDASTGALRWGVRVANCVRVGARAGGRHPSGYRFVKVDGVSYAAHRLVWLHVYGRWPKQQIDHRNGCRDDNRIDNLRECAAAENNQNTIRYRNNVSGYPGVGWHRATGQWRARIDVGGKQQHLGTFASVDDAKRAYLFAKAELHPFQPVPRA